MADIRESILWKAVNRRLEIDRPYIIAVTGSIAKTSTKEAIGAVLKTYYPGKVRVGYGNLNTYLGVPLAILGFEIDFHKQNVKSGWFGILLKAWWRGKFKRLPKFVVLEFGADKPGDIGEITAKIHPNIGIVTAIGEAHLMNYPSEEALAREKGKLLAAVKKDGIAIINRKDRFASLLSRMSSARIVEVNCSTAELAKTIARTVGQHLKVPAHAIDKALTTNWQPAGRMQEKTIGPFTVVDDSYNASPLAMKAVLEQLKQRKTNGNKVAILGSMLELGANEIRFHQKVGQLAHKCSDLVIGVGELARHYQPDHWFATSDEAAKSLFDYLKPGDTILVKGSHGIHMEKIISALTQQYEHR